MCTISNLTYFFASTISSPQRELSVLIKQNHFRREVEGHSRSVIQDYGYDREGKKTRLRN